MKIAVQFFGHLRDFENCYKNFKKNILDRYDSDVFIHTWDMKDHNTKSWNSRNLKQKQVDSLLINKIKNLYNPKKLIVEKQKPIDSVTIPYLLNDKISFSTETMEYMFYSMNISNQMRKKYSLDNEIFYDYILVLRPDIDIISIFDIDSYVMQAELMNMDVEKCRFFPTRNVTASNDVKLLINQPNDLFFFGKPKLIDTYIASNLSIDSKYAKDHAISIVSIYTSIEIKNDIIPVPIAYNLGNDWTFMGYRIISGVKNRNWGIFKKILGYAFFVFFYPLRTVYKYLEKKYPWMLK